MLERPREFISRPPWMVFVDGENLAIRGKDVAKAASLELLAGPNYASDTFLWFPDVSAEALVHRLTGGAGRVVRSHYYTSVLGDDDALRKTRRALRDLGFEPNVFKRVRGREKSKGVDISIARDMLVHGIDGVYENCLLVAGDGDYIPLVAELKRRARHVHVAFFETSGLSEDLRIEADRFHPLEAELRTSWDAYLFPRLKSFGLSRAAADLLGRRMPGGEMDQAAHVVRFRRNEHYFECDAPHTDPEQYDLGYLSGLFEAELKNQSKDIIAGFAQ